MKGKVSVILPIYNVAPYIEESLCSICEQEYKNFELILVNDETKDNSMQLAMEVLSKYQVEYTVINKINKGLPSARNTGLMAAHGKYVCFIDSDDIIAKNHLSDLVHCCEKFNVKVSYAKFQLTYENNRNGKPARKENSCSVQHDDLLQDFLIRKIKIHCCALLIDRSYLRNNKILFNEKLLYGEDIDFMWRLFASLDAIGSTGNETYLYLQRKNSLMTEQNLDRVLLLISEFEITVNQLIKKYPNDNKRYKFLHAKATLAFYRTFAESAPYTLFLELLERTEYKKTIRNVLKIDSFKLRTLTRILLISPWVFVKIVRKNRETVEK